ncbi:ABC transporter ATP-binding protein [Paenibacillus gansuensis]|uniref:ABC transporter ATP-binding protein n=1 Tax=Paenibacillus gansuensis TaxID=306542 RepID=A0ABW5PIZ5_9BACL
MMRYKWIISGIKLHLWMYLSSTALLIISVCTSLILTAIQKNIIDNIFVKGEYNLFVGYMIIFCVVIVIFLLSWVGQDILFQRLNEKIKVYMRNDYMLRLYKLPAYYYQNERKGNLISNINEYIATGSIVAQTIPRGMEGILSLIIIASIIGATSISLLCALLLLGLSYIYLGKYFSLPIARIAKEIQESRKKVMVNIDEGISSTREVISFNANDWEMNKFNKGFENYYLKLLEDARLRNIQMFWSDPLKLSSSIVVLIYGGYQVMYSELSIGMFVILYQFTSQLMNSIQTVYQVAMEFIEIAEKRENSRRIFNAPSLNSGPLQIKGNISSLKFDSISFRYEPSEKSVLSNLSHSIAIGRKTAIVGGSGSGKSTLTKLLVRLDEPNNGAIMVNDIPLYQLQRYEWTQKVSIVFQEPYIFPDTIENNILLGRNYRYEDIKAACIAAEIHDTITLLKNGYQTILGEMGVNLSGGQRQRIAIARALLGKPEVLILDEATSALDQETERKIQSNLDSLRKGKTTIVVAHRLSSIQDSDQIIIMDEGKVVDVGSHNQLIDKEGKYKILLNLM